MTPNTYLLALAALAVSFVGFSTLVITLRQTAGGALSLLDAFLMRTFIQLGFLVVAGALLPPLLSLSSLEAAKIWRLASIAVSVPALFFAITYPSRRQFVFGKRTPTSIYTDVAVLSAAGLLLALNASGLIFAPEPFVFAASLTLILCLSGWAYLQALTLLLREHLSHSDGRGE